jgi:asparagine synthase (glutamine-hydrolysing)
MCGIAGYVGCGGEGVLKKMADTVSHRGPDDEGFYEKGTVGLAHRRLSIIDLSQTGHQPITGEDGSVHVILNGEIYNYKNLRATLGRHSFKGNSDTEAIVHLYEDIGAEVFSRLEGMFALALYDEKKNTLFLARDRMGKKPLYYGIFDGTLIFGSEIKALLAHPVCKRELDLSSLNAYLQYEYVPTPQSMFQGIFKLEPGHYATYDGKTLSKRPFWYLSFPDRTHEVPLSFSDARTRFDDLLKSSVEKRLMSDVPLGVFLSGGIDSSTVAYYAQALAKEKNASNVKTFSIGFSEKSFDESVYAQRVAEHLGTEHFEKMFSVKDAEEVLPKVGEMLDEPLADPSILPTYLLSQFTREHVTVALGGDGGDELTLGYDTFIAHKLADFYEHVPAFLRRGLIEPIVSLLPTSWNNLSVDFKAKKFVSGFQGEKKYRNEVWLGAFSREERSRLFHKDIWGELKDENEFAPIDWYQKESGTENLFDQLTYTYLRTYMMDDILVKVDRASMMHALEVRAPFLDREVVEFLTSLPASYKLHGFTTKYILKDLMKDKLPYDIVYRKKKGFGIPVAEWISGDLKPFVLDLLGDERITHQGIFNAPYVRTLLRDHFEKRRDNRKQIWTLLMFQLWHNQWL